MKRTRTDVWRSALAALMLLSSSPLFFSCAMMTMQKSAKGMEKDIVKESAERYWHAVRWGDGEKAMQWLERPEDQSRLWEYLLSSNGKVSILDPSVYLVQARPGEKTAEVSVAFQMIRVNEGLLEEHRLTQRWYMKGERWYVELTPEELKALGGK